MYLGRCMMCCYLPLFWWCREGCYIANALFFFQIFLHQSICRVYSLDFVWVWVRVRVNEKEICWRWCICIDEGRKSLAFRQHGWYADTAWVSPPSSHEEAEVDYCLGVVCLCLSNLCLYLPTAEQFDLLCLLFQRVQGFCWLASAYACKRIHRRGDCFACCD